MHPIVNWQGNFQVFGCISKEKKKNQQNQQKFKLVLFISRLLIIRILAGNVCTNSIHITNDKQKEEETREVQNLKW